MPVIVNKARLLIWKKGHVKRFRVTGCQGQRKVKISLNAQVENPIWYWLLMITCISKIAIANHSRCVIFMPYQIEVLFPSFFLRFSLFSFFFFIFFLLKCKKIRIKRKFAECLRTWTSFELSQRSVKFRMNIWGHRFSQNANQTISRFLTYQTNKDHSTFLGWFLGDCGQYFWLQSLFVW